MAYRVPDCFLVKFPWRTTQLPRHKEKFYYRSTCWSPSPPLIRLVPPLLSLWRAPPWPLSSGLDPFKWSQCNRTISTSARAFHSGHRRRNNRCPSYLLVTTLTNAFLRSDYSSSSSDNFHKSRFRRRCLRVVDRIKWAQKVVPPSCSRKLC